MKLSIENNTLHIKLNLLEKILSFRGSFQIPVDHIIGVTSTKPAKNWAQVRSPGIHIPFLIKAGTYHGNHSKEFWFTTIGMPYLVIELKNWDFNRVVITSRNNKGWAELIENACKSAGTL